MITYKDFRPTSFDSHIEMKARESWYVLCVGVNRDSGCLEESNWETALKLLQATTLSEEAQDLGESDHEVLDFSHWANGWFRICIIRPGTPSHITAQDIETNLDIYPILNEEDLSEREHEAATYVWEICYNNAQRLEYIRENRSQFEFRSFAEMLGCVRGSYFCGYASELLGG